MSLSIPSNTNQSFAPLPPKLSDEKEPFTASPDKIEAVNKIGKWIKRRFEARKNVRRENTFKAGSKASKIKVRFITERIQLEGRNQLGNEVNAILRYYASSDGKLFLQTNPSADDNRTIWMDISKSLVLNSSYVPIVARNENQELEAMAMVSITQKFNRFCLEQLATAPHNLGKRSGAGSAAFEEVVRLCQETGYESLTLNTMNKSQSFYENKGVKFDYNHGTLQKADFPEYFKKHGGIAKPK